MRKRKYGSETQQGVREATISPEQPHPAVPERPVAIAEGEKGGAEDGGAEGGAGGERGGVTQYTRVFIFHRRPPVGSGPLLPPPPFYLSPGVFSSLHSMPLLEDISWNKYNSYICQSI